MFYSQDSFSFRLLWYNAKSFQLGIEHWCIFPIGVDYSLLNNLKRKDLQGFQPHFQFRQCEWMKPFHSSRMIIFVGSSILQYILRFLQAAKWLYTQKRDIICHSYLTLDDLQFEQTWFYRHQNDNIVSLLGIFKRWDDFLNYRQILKEYLLFHYHVC